MKWTKYLIIIGCVFKNSNQSVLKNPPNLNSIAETEPKNQVLEVVIKNKECTDKTEGRLESSNVKECSKSENNTLKARIQNIKLNPTKDDYFNTQEKCYVVNTTFVPVSDIEKLVEEFQKHQKAVRFIYKRNILGFSFCAPYNIVSKIVESITGKYSLVNIEEDKIFKLAYTEQYSQKSQQNVQKMLINSTFEEKIVISSTNNNANEAIKQDRKIVQSHLPLHFFRMMNTGNLIFNNYFLDNIIFRLLGINKLIKYFYKYEYSYDGKGIQVKVIGTPKCNSNRIVNEALLNNIEYSLSKGSKVEFIETVSCDRTIKLSKLLHVLEQISNANILVIPLYGPYSEALDAALKRISRRMTVITAAGDDGEEGCNYSPNGKYIIKVGSATKHGQISEFSNRGNCVNLYSLGEDILDKSGTSYSAAFIAGAVAIYKEKNPDATHHDILRFLFYSSVRNEYNQPIFKIPYLSTDESEKMKRPVYYSLYEVMFYNLLIALFVMVLICLTVYLIKRIRERNADRSYFARSLRQRASPLESTRR
ncbi:uncharacterized protein VICG_01385 [Vittaforma corneae ATCC 50505]|uniref:Peptidase S8/S53 domain-containing protein n=1 Tax=Vittaforma corneae (strain ATCC 50505) TaxID=993615 RepID=L2GKY9_VITCO|nr:uncharacterized protein VICG_01385 [Vittaforma corneae ATCC 50505]ELA41521.1 hypothetical protein VICG_01385 [Vittaforma corneae ATCC 50505]